jgi:hypothetical protein
MRSGTRDSEKLENGQKVRDVHARTEGVILDFACQYAHPKAAPVYSYLIRWKDGQVQAVTESAFSRDGGLEVID